MSNEAWIAFGTLGFTLIAAIVAIVARFIKIEMKVESMEMRDNEERIKNSEQHKEFYDFRRETEPMIAEILQQLTSLTATTNRIEVKIDDERRSK